LNGSRFHRGQEVVPQVPIHHPKQLIVFEGLGQHLVPVKPDQMIGFGSQNDYALCDTTRFDVLREFDIETRRIPRCDQDVDPRTTL
jgi:hypothetical protein